MGLIKPLSDFMFRKGQFTNFYHFKFKLWFLNFFKGQVIDINEEAYSQSQSQRSLSQNCENMRQFDGNEDIADNNPPPVYDESEQAAADENIEDLEQRLR